MPGQAQVGMNATILEALRVGTSVHIEPPSSAQDRGLYIVEAYSHSQHARAKKCVTSIDDIPSALEQVVAEVAPPVLATVDGCEDLV